MTRIKKVFPIGLVVLGLLFIGGGIYTTAQGLSSRAEVRDQLVAQEITTPPDAEIPNALVEDAATTKAMADIIGVHALEATGGKTYAEMGRFLTPEGGDTSDEAAALKDSEGNPVPNPLRNVAFQASSLRSMLYTSHMAFKVSDLVIGLGALILALGVAVGGIGVAFAGLAIPTFARRVGVEPIVAPTD